MDRWHQDLEYEFRQRWDRELEDGSVPNRLYVAIKDALGDYLEPDKAWVHAVGPKDEIGFLLVQDDDVLLIRFDPPNDTTIHTSARLQVVTMRRRLTSKLVALKSTAPLSIRGSVTSRLST